jgi:hypothetical protein
MITPMRAMTPVNVPTVRVQVQRKLKSGLRPLTMQDDFRPFLNVGSTFCAVAYETTNFRD